MTSRAAARLRGAAAAAFAAAGALAAGCAAHLTTPGPQPTGQPTTSPSGVPSGIPTASASATPQACGSPANANIYVAMSFGIAPANSQYGALFGFGAVDSQGNVPAVAAPIEGVVGNVVQFVNLDDYDSNSLTLRSAAGFPNATSFPPVPYSFPAADYSVLNTVIGNAGWSTGLILPSPSTDPPCYSQAFTLSTAGTYYFGDVLYYNAGVSSPRGVVVVTSAATERGRHSIARRPRR